MKSNRKWIMALALAGMAALLLAGCENDETAPNDELPPVSEQGAARQAGLMAMAVAQAGPAVLLGPNKDMGTWTFSGGDVTGSFTLDFRCGGMDGTPCADDVADWAHAWTDAEAPLVMQVEIGGLQTAPMTIGFDLEAVIDQDADTAVISSLNPGTFVAGEYDATWEVDGVLVALGGDYPEEGTVTLTVDGTTAVVTYDGDAIVTITVGELSLLFDLGTADFVEI